MIKVIGIRRLDYVNKEGRAVKGYNFFFAEDVEKVIGVASFNSFLSDDLVQPILMRVGEPANLVGKEVDLIYNRYGRLSVMKIVK